MASHVSQCMEKACMCVTHVMPCVNMHATFEAYIYGAPIQFIETSKGGEKEEEGKRGREERRREREERKGEREEKKRKGKKKREEERGGREEKERGKGRSVAQ